MALTGIKELFERSDASGSKSTILKPLTWFLSVLIGGIILIIRIEAPLWLIIFFASIILTTMILFFFAYIYCLFKDRDALRSEKYSIQKLALEKGIYGDNLSGILSESKNFKHNTDVLSEKSEWSN